MPAAPKSCALEAARGASLAAHAAAGLAACATEREATRLLRAAEGLCRAATALLVQRPAAPPAPQPAAATAAPRRRRRARRGRPGTAAGSADQDGAVNKPEENDALLEEADTRAGRALALTRGKRRTPGAASLDDYWADNAGGRAGGGAAGSTATAAAAAAGGGGLELGDDGAGGARSEGAWQRSPKCRRGARGPMYRSRSCDGHEGAGSSATGM